MTRTARILARAIAVALVSVVLAEVALRIVLRVKGTPHERGEANARLQTIFERVNESFGATRKEPGKLDEPRAKHVVHPLQGYDYSGLDQAYDQQLVVHRETAERALDVFVYGGSVSTQVGNEQPQVIIDALSADARCAGREVRIYCHGRGGYKQPQSLYTFHNDLLLGFRPDVVVLIDGFNELAVAATGPKFGVHPLFPGGEFWMHMAHGTPSQPMLDAAATVRREIRFTTSMVSAADALGLTHSALLSRLWIALVSSSHARFVHAQGTYVTRGAERASDNVAHGPSFEHGTTAVTEMSAEIWFESARSMDALCKLHGLRFVHVLQPTLHDQGAKPVTEQERRLGAAIDEWIHSTRDGYPRLRELGERLRALGSEFHDASQLFRDDAGEIYVDACHYNERGSEALARFTAEAILSTERPFERSPADE